MPTLMIRNSVTAVVSANKDDDFLLGYREMIEGPRLDGMLRSELLRGQEGRWLIQTLWRDRAAIAGARDPGRPLSPALALCEQVGPTQTHEVFAAEERRPGAAAER